MTSSSHCSCGRPHVATRLHNDSEYVFVFAYATHVEAEHSAECNRAIYGHRSWAEYREADGWVSVVDIELALARIDQKWSEQ